MYVSRVSAKPTHTAPDRLLAGDTVMPKDQESDGSYWEVTAALDDDSEKSPVAEVIEVSEVIQKHIDRWGPIKEQLQPPNASKGRPLDTNLVGHGRRN